MPKTITAHPHELSSDTHHRARESGRISIPALGTSLGLFFAITFTLCVLFDLWVPSMAMNSLWAPLLPGFTWISWSSFLLGLVETFAYGWYIALIFAPLYNYFSRIFRPQGG